MMKNLIFLVGAIFLLACNSNQSNNPKTESVKNSNIVTIHYKCDQGKLVIVDYDNTDSQKGVAYVMLDTAKKEKIKMTITMSASGARYTDGKLVWWTKGNTAYLMEEGNSGNEKVLIDNCNEFVKEK